MTIPPQSSGGDWAVSPREKAEFDSLFNQVDKEGKGFITGEEAVPFFSNSKLPEDVLAQIWDLADIKKMGRLTRDSLGSSARAGTREVLDCQILCLRTLFLQA
jgi:epidermal growth factor receptor substrate 15